MNSCAPRVGGRTRLAGLAGFVGLVVAVLAVVSVDAADDARQIVHSTAAIRIWALTLRYSF